MLVDIFIDICYWIKASPRRFKKTNKNVVDNYDIAKLYVTFCQFNLLDKLLVKLMFVRYYRFNQHQCNTVQV